MGKLFCVAALAFSSFAIPAFAQNPIQEVKLSVGNDNNAIVPTLINYTLQDDNLPKSCATAYDDCVRSCSPIAQPGVQECFNNCKGDDYECQSFCYAEGEQKCAEWCDGYTVPECTV